MKFAAKIIILSFIKDKILLFLRFCIDSTTVTHKKSELHLRFVKNYHGGDEHYWSHLGQDISSWEGYAFEQVCLHHIPQIKHKLGISGILTNVCSWSCKPYIGKDGEEHKGAQIDLIIDRGDKTINLCEMKFTNKPFAISAEYAQRMLERRDDDLFHE